MAHPPPAPTPQVPQLDQKALDAIDAKRLEVHVDAWLRGQHPHAPRTIEVSIGERDSIRPEVLALLCAKYAKAGWSKATTAQDLEGGAPDPRGIVLTLVPPSAEPAKPAASSQSTT